MSTDDNLQKEIGNYRVVREIDSGAFGRVYLAQHTLLKNRTVAIKLLHTTHLSSMEERESFLREAQFLEVLKHPYILPILDVGIHEGFPYLVAEYAPNGSLRDRIKRYAPHPLPIQETLTLLTQVGQALYYAHQQHIIHRDIKPENILFNARGEAMLADFGVATMMETASIKFATLIGTPSYMAPEQFQNSVSKESISTRWDASPMSCLPGKGHLRLTTSSLWVSSTCAKILCFHLGSIHRYRLMSSRVFSELWRNSAPTVFLISRHSSRSCIYLPIHRAVCPQCL
jgi:serine/threonine protein kinase